MLIVGTWKNKVGFTDSLNLARQLADWVSSHPTASQLVILPGILSLSEVRRVLPPSVMVGAQNVGWDADHALTGETSASSLAEVGCDLVMVGHSERRAFLGESDEQVAWKVGSLLAHGLKPLVCVGEDYEQRVGGATQDVLAQQLDSIMPHLSRAEARGVAIAYEPAWAITTSAERLPANPDLAAVDHRWIRNYLTDALGEKGGEVPLIYGAGVNPGNARDFSLVEEVDGLLVGGASQSLESFSELLGNVEAKTREA